ncbi:heat shock protein Hsp20 [Richelia sinica FACHB-800]|uniref:Heat shock protein Hsp20 n=1 Tax=Richelia sinica FACHB-800 TaxID=1357546 RepID=A0A975T7A2_9NOST|nr:Hsp20/alpha crystallin family protein [Richelia sinica]MBD2666818.1 Hsp20/alpha crystallin family protein [Richelia sinica FACHB-800]QXE23434.1 heat shock protein Hsp20 [Richelia sinica FACHB-800]
MLIRYNPWQELTTLQRQLDRLFEDPKIPSPLFDKNCVKVPAAELAETEDAIHLKLELPGIAAKDIDVQVTEDSVSISAERRTATETEEKGVKKSEFHYGKFHRVIPLPTLVQNTKVEAEYKDGILHLHLPKMEQEKPKVVKINLEQPKAEGSKF